MDLVLYSPFDGILKSENLLTVRATGFEMKHCRGKPDDNDPGDNKRAGGDRQEVNDTRSRHRKPSDERGSCTHGQRLHRICLPSRFSGGWRPRRRVVSLFDFQAPLHQLTHGGGLILKILPVLVPRLGYLSRVIDPGADLSFSRHTRIPSARHLCVLTDVNTVLSLLTVRFFTIPPHHGYVRRWLDTPAIRGPVIGVGAFAIGYLIVLAITIVGEQATLVAQNNPQAAGWLYYNAQLANVVTIGGNGGWTTAFTGQEFNLLTQILWNQPVPTGQLIEQSSFLSGVVPPATYHCVPIVILFAAGFLFVRRGNVETTWGAVAASGSIAMGTTLAASVGTLLLTVQVDGLVIRPDPLEGILMAGLFFPMAISVLGCLAATRT